MYVVSCLRGQCRLLYYPLFPWTYVLQSHTGNELTQGRSTTIHRIACMGSWSKHQCCGEWVWDENGEYFSYSKNWIHIYCIPRMLTITPPRLHNFTTLPTPACIFGSLPESSVQTTYSSYPSECTGAGTGYWGWWYLGRLYVLWTKVQAGGGALKQNTNILFYFILF